MIQIIKNFIKRLRISPVDIFALIFFGIILITVFLFFYRKGEYVTIRVKVITNETGIYTRVYPPSWFANRFEIGDKEIDALGRTNAEIINIDRYNISSDRVATFLDIKLKATYNSRTKQYTTKGKTLTYGTPLQFAFSKIAFDSFVTETPQKTKKNDDAKYVTVVARDRGIDTILDKTVEPEVYQSIKKGDRIYNSNKTLLAEVLEVSLVPAVRVTQTNMGILTLQQDPLYNNIVLTLSVRTNTINGELYMFDTQPLKIGERIPLNFSHALIAPVIIKIP